MANKILYAGAHDSDTPLSLTLAGETDPGSTMLIKRDRDSDIFVFQYITEGEGIFKIGGQTFLVKSGDFLIAPARMEYSYFPCRKNPWGKVWMNLRGRLLDELIRLYGLSGNFLFPECTEAGKLLRQTIGEICSVDHANLQNFISLRVLEIVMLLSDFNGRQSSCGRKNQTPFLLRDYLRTKMMETPPSLEEMSSRMNLSVPQLIRVFKNEFRVTPYAFLLNEKINLAAEMLVNSEFSVREIAETLKFSNEYYFSRIFRNKKGLPPGEFRKSIRGKA